MSGPSDHASTDPGREAEPKAAQQGEAPDPRSTEPEPATGYGRPRLTVAELGQGRGSRVQIRVGLERGGSARDANLEGVGEEVMLLRLAAEATLVALGELVGRPDYFELVGIKRLFAFDTRVVLTCVRTADEPERRLVGCVPAPDDLVRGAATAVLHATNRIVESLPPPDDQAEIETDVPG